MKNLLSASLRGVIIEGTADGDTSVFTSTQTVDGGVEYKVIVDGVTTWQRVVPFGKHPSHRAGGRAFVDAAREQERLADDARKRGPQ